MKREDQNFGYKLSFRQKLEGNAYTTATVSRFACAKTAEGAIGNLEKILDGSMPYKQVLGNTSVGSHLFMIELMDLSRNKLVKLHVFKNGKEKLKVNWRMAKFHDVDAVLWDALIKTFPEQKHLFKGKMLEEALGL
jgi:hypothetical protein